MIVSLCAFGVWFLVTLADIAGCSWTGLWFIKIAVVLYVVVDFGILGIVRRVKISKKI